MLEFTNSSIHGTLKKTTNLKVLLDVLCPLFSITSAPHGTLCAGFFIESIMDLSVLKLLWSCTMGMLLWNFELGSF
jgi:hypothetical protein